MEYLDLVLDKLPASIRNDQSTLVTLGFTALCIILTLILFTFLSRGRKGHKVVIVGLSDAGKTLLFTQLASGRNVATLTSMKENECSLNVGKKTVTLVDIPGYERLRKKCWDDHRNNARAVVFVIDSFQISSNIRDVAEYLYTILTDRVVVSKRLPILIACNKQDKPKSKSAKVINSLLEKEITAIRETKQNTLESTEKDRDDLHTTLGSLDKEFSFNDIKNRSEFIDCIAYMKEDSPAQIDDIISWLNKV